MTLMHHCAIVSGAPGFGPMLFEQVITRDDITREMTNRVYTTLIHIYILILKGLLNYVRFCMYEINLPDYLEIE